MGEGMPPANWRHLQNRILAGSLNLGKVSPLGMAKVVAGTVNRSI
jgi:hypothetical protein